jgi:hypothetical protein
MQGFNQHLLAINIFDVTFITFALESKDNTWILDTKAPKHVIGNVNLLDQITLIESKHVKYAIGHFHAIHRKGDLCL